MKNRYQHDVSIEVIFIYEFKFNDKRKTVVCIKEILLYVYFKSEDAEIKVEDFRIHGLNSPVFFAALHLSFSARGFN